jgi:hypothetical protein
VTGTARVLKTSFTAGELSDRLLGRDDLRAYANGAHRLRNVVIHPTGGVSRRPGLRYVDTAAGPGRLVAFEFNTEQVYLLAFGEGRIDVYTDGVRTATVAAPWTAAQLGQINWTQSADTLLVVHPGVGPQRLTRASHTDWTLQGWSFAVENGAVRQPYHRFAPGGVTLTPSATTGAIALAASDDVFAAGHVGARLRLQGIEVEITAVN